MHQLFLTCILLTDCTSITPPKIDVSAAHALPAIVERVKDADTLVMDVYLGFGMVANDVDVRVAEFDAWETTEARRTLGLTKAEWVEEKRKGRLAKTDLERLLADAKAVHVVEDDRLQEAYNRRTLWVFIDGKELGSLMRPLGHERK